MSIVLNPTRYEAAIAAELPLTPARLAAFESRVLDSDEPWLDKVWALSAIVLVLHAAAIVGFANRDTTPTVKPPQKHQIEIAFVKPEVEPPPPPPPPPEPPPPPKVQRAAPPKPAQPVQQLRTAPATQDIAPTDLTVAENTEAPKSTGPVEAVAEPAPPASPAPVVTPPAPPAPPAPPKEEPITEATANAGYLNNPKPEYPGLAARNGWGGTVTLRVRVLANGKPEGIEVKKSSGRKVLDEAAIAAVKQWIFVPSKRGSTPIDGWATVPIVFNPEQ